MSDETRTRRAWRERLHRWRHRRLYAMLPPFYQNFYPITHAISLTMQYVEHSLWCCEQDKKEHDGLVARCVDLERTVTELRLALAAASSGWNEDQVDRFMATWFRRYELPTQGDRE